MNKTRPSIPRDILPGTGIVPDITFYEKCETFWQQILDEITDKEFITRMHQNTGTYDRGCRGPLCRKALREHPKRKTPVGLSGLTPRSERIYDPVIEYFFTVAKLRLRQYQEQLMDEMVR